MHVKGEKSAIGLTSHAPSCYYSGVIHSGVHALKSVRTQMIFQSLTGRRNHKIQGKPLPQ